MGLVFIHTIQSDLTWLSADNTSGTISGSGSQDVNLNFDASDMIGGQYLADLNITSNDPVEDSLTIPVTLDVTGAPDIMVSADTLNFGSLVLPDTSIISFIITNDGTDILDVTDIQSSNGFYSIDTTSFSLAIDSSKAVSVTFLPTANGSQDATLTIVSNDNDESSYVITLLGTGLNPQNISISPDSLYQHLYTNGDSTQVLTITNSGDVDLIWSLSMGSTLARSSASGDSTVYEFTNCGKTGREGPTQSDCDKKKHQKAIRDSKPGYIMTETEWEYATDDYKSLRKEHKTR